MLRTRVSLDGTTRTRNANFPYLIKTVHVYNYSPYNVYVSVTSATPTNGTADYIVAPDAFQSIPTETTILNFVLDIVGIPSVFNAVQVDMFDIEAAGVAQALPTPTGQQLTNLLSNVGSKAGDVTVATVSNQTLLSGSLDFSSIIPTGKCIVNLDFSYVTVNDLTFTISLMLDGVLYNTWTDFVPLGDAGHFDQDTALTGLNPLTTHTLAWLLTTSTANLTTRNTATKFPTSYLLMP